MNEKEIDLSGVSYSHLHEWRVALRIGRFHVVKPDGAIEDTGPALLVRCDCGAMGIVSDPSPAELRRATKPYRWFAHQRIRMVVRQTANGPQGTEWEVEE